MPWKIPSLDIVMRDASKTRRAPNKISLSVLTSKHTIRHRSWDVGESPVSSLGLRLHLQRNAFRVVGINNWFESAFLCKVSLLSTRSLLFAGGESAASRQLAVFPLNRLESHVRMNIYRSAEREPIKGRSYTTIMSRGRERWNNLEQPQECRQCCIDPKVSPYFSPGVRSGSRRGFSTRTKGGSLRKAITMTDK